MHEVPLHSFIERWPKKGTVPVGRQTPRGIFTIRRRYPSRCSPIPARSTCAI